ncbi:MAG: hypothetical protein JWO30_1274 [Fibrobacteres bacterium]|nr:hypothetical protein [Fibrobacterota bacterium]
MPISVTTRFRSVPKLAFLLGLAGAAWADPSPFAAYVRTVPAPFLSRMTGLATVAGTLFETSPTALYRSVDGGLNWDVCQFRSGTGFTSGSISVAAGGSRLWMALGGQGGALLHSEDAGLSWSHANPFTPYTTPTGLVSRGDTVFAYGGYGLSDDMDIGFQPPGSGDWIPFQAADGWTTHSLAAAGRYFYALRSKGQDSSGLFRTPGPRRAWERVDKGIVEVQKPGLPYGNPAAEPQISYRGGLVFAAIPGWGVFEKQDEAKEWRWIEKDFGILSEARFFPGRDFLGLITGDSTFIRGDAAGSWRAVAANAEGGYPLEGFAICGDSLLSLRNQQVKVSTDAGVSWRLLEMKSGPRESGNNRLIALEEWGGRIFMQYNRDNYRSADAGKTWRSQDWTLLSEPFYSSQPEAVLISTRKRLVLASRLYRNAAVFNPVSDQWESLRLAEDALDAVGGDGERIYRYSIAGSLEYSEDPATGWIRIPFPSAISGGLYQRIQASGDRILLTSAESSPQQNPLGTFDGGATWTFYPDSARMLIDGDCFRWIDRGALYSQCGSAPRALTRPAPFHSAQRLFRDGKGALFALADSTLFTLDLNGAAPDWGVLASKADLRGWDLKSSVLYRHVDGKVQWFSPEAAHGTDVSMPARRFERIPSNSRPAWIEAGRRPDGRAVGSDKLRQ